MQMCSCKGVYIKIPECRRVTPSLGKGARVLDALDAGN